jgi:two-component system NtrC family sensor kinase
MFTDRMASIGTLVAGVAHEINNPLAYVMTNIAVLRGSSATTRRWSCARRSAIPPMAHSGSRTSSAA